MSAAQIAAFEEDKKQYQEQLDIVLASVRDDPDNAELAGLKAELQEAINLINESIAELSPHAAAAAPAPKPAAPASSPKPEKWSRGNHPAYRAAAEADRESSAADTPPPVAAATAQSYQVNDTVLAKWVSGDKGFYTARITSITGPPTARMYTVKFKSYDTVETLRAHEVRPVQTQKRKADGQPVPAATATTANFGSSGPADAAGGGAAGYSPSPGVSTPPTGPPAAAAAAAAASNNGIVASAAANMYTEAQQQQQGQGGEDGAGPPAKKFKKIKANKELEAGKNKWQDFNAKSKFGKTKKKDSMFRTPESHTGRVGFTGSGQAMRKDPTRSKHIYQQSEDMD